MKRKYRVTPRGKVVFSVTGILFVLIVFMIIQSLAGPKEADVEMPGQTGETTQVEQVRNESANSNDTVLTNENAADSNDTDLDDEENTEADSDATQEAAGASEEIEDSGAESLESEQGVPLDSEKAEALYNALTTVYFEPDKYDLSSEYKLALNVFINIANTYPDEKIRIEGNINGYPKFNDSKFGEELSQIRANKVAQYLMNRGIAQDMLTVISNGSSKPLNKSDAPEELMLNRRTDVYFENYFLEDEQTVK